MQKTIAALIIGAALASACSSSDTKASVDTTTSVPRDRSGEPAYSKPGPYAVGYTTVKLSDREVTVWYPADQAAVAGKSKATYDQRTPLPEEYKGLVPDKYNTVVTMDAYEDVKASAKGPFPLVMESHGAGGYRLVNSALAVGIASWGYVVTSTDYFERGLRGQLPGARKYPRDPGRDERNMFATYDLTKRENDTKTSLLYGVVDFKHVGAVGHSAGGGTAFNALKDDRVSVAVGWAPVPPTGTPADKPAMIIGARGDSALTPEALAKTYASFTGPTRYLQIEAGGHNTFSDVCIVIRQGGGLIQFAIDNGFVEERLAKLGYNGCEKKDIDAATFWPVAQHFTVAQLRDAFKQDAEPVGLGSKISTAFGSINVTYEAKP